jgi:hypothetical protein
MPTGRSSADQTPVSVPVSSAFILLSAHVDSAVGSGPGDARGAWFSAGLGCSMVFIEAAVVVTATATATAATVAAVA